MADRIRRRIIAVTLTLVMVISLMPVVTLTAHADAAASIELVATPIFNFTAATEGYGAQAPYSVRIDSTGTAATGALTVALDGTSPAAFELSHTSLSSIEPGGNTSITVKPTTGLSAGNYTATVTVSGSAVTAKSFNVSFSVDPAGTTYTATIYTNVNSIATDADGSVELVKGTSTITASKSGTGIYTAAVENGDYFIYINGTDTGRGIVISSSDKSVTLDYYTVSFSTTYSGTATGSNIGASVDGVAISSGSRVLSGKTVEITASGTGAGSYTYAWTGSGTSGQTTAQLSISPLNTSVSAVCAVTGSGTPPADPDYEINGSGHSWTGSDETIVLSGSSDTLTIHTTPSAVIKIEVQSGDGSTVTIDGNSVACDNTRIVVSNDITLTLNNLDITAPLNWSAIQLNSDSGAATMTINVTGTCSLTGTGFGCGIRSEYNRNLVISGSGTLNATGGGNVSGTDGGAGIFTISNPEGGSLTIEGTLTVNAIGGSSLTHSGGGGIDAASGSILIKSGIVNATSGVSYGTNYNSSHGIRASFPSIDHSVGGNIIIEGGTVTAVGGDAENVSGGYGIYAFNNLSIEGGNVTVIGGNSVNAAGGAGALAYEQNLEISGGVLDVTGGNSENNYGGQAIYNFYKDILISGGTVTATGGQSTNKDGGRGIVVAGTGKLMISGGTVTATGGNGGVNGAHALYANLGTITVSNGADLTALGGTGTTAKGGVGLRAAGYDGTTLYGNTVTIANSAGDVYIRGGQGVSERRASIMGKDVYIGTGNIGPVVMEGSNPRSIKNTAGGDNLYLVNVSTDPAAAVEIRCTVSGVTAPDYTYRAVAAADGTACLWLPVGARILSATGYIDANTNVFNSDTGNSASVSTTSVSNSNTGKGKDSSPQTTNAIVEVNGQKQDAGEAKTETSRGKTVTTIKVDDTKLEKILDEKGNNATVTLPVNTSSDVVVGELNGQTVKNMEKKEAILEIKTSNVSYTLPASQINIDNVSEQIGQQVELKDIKVSVKISEPPADTVKVVEDTANKSSYQIVVKPVEFEITCTSGSKTIDVSRFNGYVERTVAIPDGVDPSKITTGIVLNADGSFRHVPTQIIVINGKYYAKINSLTNSTYSVIYNPVTFADAAKHWAKDAINDMGSRLVVTGDGKGSYSPDKNITRAEFAAIVVRALGLAPGIGENSFGDVKSSAWYSGYIETAASYGIITGYSASKFGPSDTITREQAMTMISRSMKITGLESDLTQQQIADLIGVYQDGNNSSNYAKEGIAACLKNGVAFGVGNNAIAPKSYVTRAEVAVMFQRLLQKSELI